MEKVTNLSVIIPAYNEEKGIEGVLTRVHHTLRDKYEYEIIVVNDGSHDQTAQIAVAAGASVIANPLNMGYGFSLKRGFRAAKNECVVITDADGTYPIEKIPELVTAYAAGVDMVVGARQGQVYWSSPLKKVARHCFKWMSEFVVGERIPDINSGLRVIRRSRMLPVLSDLSTGFSFTTSATLIFFLKHYLVQYRPVPYDERKGESKVRYIRDSLQTMQIMADIIVRYNPIKLFLLVALAPFIVFLVFIFVSIWQGQAFWLLLALPPLFFSLLLLSLGFLATIFRKT